ncbi:MAG: hypothetical protein ACTSXQ_07135 [Alphaproteobacteria bacterium]
MKIKNTLLTACALGLLSTQTAEAAKNYPYIDGEIFGQLQYDNVVKSDNEQKEVYDLYWTIFPTVNLHLSPEWKIKTVLGFEPVFARDTENRFMNEHGLYLDTLSLNYEKDALSLYAGKFLGEFGVAAYQAPGVYGVDLSEAYPLYDRIGVGAKYAFDMGDAGTHTFGVESYFQDTTLFSDSAFKRRGNLQKDDGGVSNTEDLSSFFVRLEGTEMKALDGLNYYLHYVDQARGVDNSAREKRYLGATTYRTALTNDVDGEFLLEHAFIDNAWGDKGVEERYYTGAAKLIKGPWNTAFSATEKDTDNTDGSKSEESSYQVSSGYGFENGLSVDLGWNLREEDAIKSHIIGVVFTYINGF